MHAVRFIKIAAVALVAAAASAGAGWAFDEKPFDAKAFAAAQDAGKPILVDAFAPWCPVCKAQQQVLGTLQQDAKYAAVTVFKIDYDNQPDALQSLNVRKQSTLIAFKGKTETGRTVGDTKQSSITALVDSALN
jgi:thiol-disulfide isomerase/thioredoxin